MHVVTNGVIFRNGSIGLASIDLHFDSDCWSDWKANLGYRNFILVDLDRISVVHGLAICASIRDHTLGLASLRERK